MKGLNLMSIAMLAIMGMMLVQSASCTKKEGEKKNLDPALFGTWAFIDSDNEVLFWTFRDNGTSTQSVYGQTYSWMWEIENGQLKLFVTGGVPAFQTYKIEGNQLFFWVEMIDNWGLPFTKQ